MRSVKKQQDKEELTDRYCNIDDMVQLFWSYNISRFKFRIDLNRCEVGMDNKSVDQF